MIGNITIPAITSLADVAKVIPGVELTKAGTNGKLSSWTGKDASGHPITVTLSQGAPSPTSDSFGRYHARIKCVVQVPEQSRATLGLTVAGDPIYGSRYVDSIVDCTISSPVALTDNALKTWAAQVLSAVIAAAPSALTEGSL